MRFMIIVRATPDAAAADIAARIREFHARLDAAGALLDAAQPLPGAPGWRQDRRSEAGATEARPGIAGYALIQARDVEAALEWLRRFPGEDGQATEVEMLRLR